MLDVLANSLMIASRAPATECRRPEAARLADNETARARRSREIAAFLATARASADPRLTA